MITALKKFHVILLTYNQEKYIAQALESILTQKTNFDFVVRVFDDCSKDNTAAIAKKYAEKNSKVEVYVNKKNLGAKGNILKAFRLIDTKYFAILEGDDYWSDDNKIQMQINLLESNPNAIICGHNTSLMKAEKIEGSILPQNFAEGKNIFDVLDVIEGRFYSHPSAIVYRTLSSELMNFLIKSKDIYPRLGDFFNLMFFAQNGDLLYIDKIMSVYRTDSGGIWSSVGEIKKQEDNIFMTTVYQKLLDQKYFDNFCNGALHTVKSFAKDLKSQKGFWLKRIKYFFLLRYLKRYSFKSSVVKFVVSHLQEFSFAIYRAMSAIGL